MSTNERLIEQIKQNYESTCYWVGEVNGDVIMIHLLMYHCAVIINPQPFGGYEYRYCYHNPLIATIAIAEFIETEKWRHWKKDHTKNISVACGNKLFKEGIKHIPELAIGEVDWDISEFDKIYPY